MRLRTIVVTYDVQQMKVLMTLVLVLLLAGCAAGEGGAGLTTTRAETTVHSAQEETTVLTGEENLRRPPDSTLSYGGQEVKGTLGSYCWTSGRTGVCADAPFLTPPRKKMLTVPSGSEMVFRYGGQRSPDTVDAEALSLNKKGQARMTRRPPASRLPPLEAHGSGVERTIPVELPQGEYVVLVGVTEPQGDPSYFFRIMVESPD